MKRNIFISLIILFLWGCFSNSQENSSQIEKKNLESLPTLTEIVWKDYDEILFLLSHKYNVDSSIVKPLITEFLRIHDPLTYFSLTIDYQEKDTTVFDYILKPREDINATINRLSLFYTIDASTLSSFIYDFMVYNKLLKIEEEIDNY